MPLAKVGPHILMNRKEYTSWKRDQFNELLRAITLLQIASDSFPKEIKEKLDKLFNDIDDLYKEFKEYYARQD
uniref:Uncharacterized protein n=1 Tax=viral metagenome TaxID=1070528 RepID=A0A6M3L8J9_9ZZZZ